MDMTLLVELVTSLGLPIALIIALLWFIYRIYKRSELREDALRSQIVESQKVNAQAIQTITLYAERLTVIENDIKEVKQDMSLLLQK